MPRGFDEPRLGYGGRSIQVAVSASITGNRTVKVLPLPSPGTSSSASQEMPIPLPAMAWLPSRSTEIQIRSTRLCVFGTVVNQVGKHLETIRVTTDDEEETLAADSLVSGKSLLSGVRA